MASELPGRPEHFPLARLALCRLLVLIAMRLIPSSNWAWDRLYYVNHSLKMQSAAIRADSTGG